MKQRKITKVIIPVAGSGTRFLPATKAQPKEMLPVIDKPVIQYLVEEAVAAGITEIIFVTGRNKRAIEDHFDAAPELEAQLAAQGKTKALEEVRSIPKLAKFSFVRQQAPLGDGDAVLCAEHLINGDEYVGVMFGDDIFVGSPRLTQMKKVFDRHPGVVAALERVPKKEVTRYGVVDAKKRGRLYDIHDVVEKPALKDAPSNLILMGTYIINRDIFKLLRKLQKEGGTGELRIANALRAYSKHRPIAGIEMRGKRYDCGDKMGYLKTIVDFAAKRPEFKTEFRAHLKQVLK